MSFAKWPSLVQSFNHQIYISKSRNPFFNLSLEHYLLTKTPPQSKVLFLYHNRPCVVIGRNQNPWLEVNLNELRLKSKHSKGFEGAEFLRRRSGGGAVYHDEGNLNYCAICPSDVFTRDQHAGMVTRAIRRFNPRARVNERHDIVLDQGDQTREMEMSDDMHSSGFETSDPSRPPLKISGSAFKLVKGRGLHHGTCLLDCDRLDSISKYLRSPGRGNISALGVESVRSPVGNAFGQLYFEQRTHTHQAFQFELLKEFQKLWNIDPSILKVQNQIMPELLGQSETADFAQSDRDHDWVVGVLNDDFRKIEEIQSGMDELRVR